jgi:hypothetical protein
MSTVKETEEKFSKVFTPTQAMAEFEYLEYLEAHGQNVCQIEKKALANIAAKGDWNVTG